jgi:hypothetical protein
MLCIGPSIRCGRLFLREMNSGGVRSRIVQDLAISVGFRWTYQRWGSVKSGISISCGNSVKRTVVIVQLEQELTVNALSHSLSSPSPLYSGP